MPRPSPSPFPTNRPNFFVEPSTTIESLKNSSTRCELLASKCSSTPSKDPHVEKEEYHPKCALSSRHSTLGYTFLAPWAIAKPKSFCGAHFLEMSKLQGPKDQKAHGNLCYIALRGV